MKLQKQIGFEFEIGSPISRRRICNKIKEELGNKKYSQLKTNGELKKLEENLKNKKATIYQLLEDL